VIAELVTSARYHGRRSQPIRSVLTLALVHEDIDEVAL
jgi:hypothetical protein